MHINDLKTITLPKENRPLLLALLVVPCILAVLEMPIKIVPLNFAVTSTQQFTKIYYSLCR